MKNLWLSNYEFNMQIRTFLKVFYSKKLLGSAGRNLYIHPSATFCFPQRIHLADECKIYKGAYLNARTDNDLGIVLGKGVKIHEYSYLDSYLGSIEFDDFSGCGHHCVIGGHGKLKVGKYSMISGLTYIIPANHGFTRTDIPYVLQEENRLGIIIGENVWIGASCILLAGITIGDNTIIGAGSIVTKDIPANCIALGSPAQVIKYHR